MIKSCNEKNTQREGKERIQNCGQDSAEMTYSNIMRKLQKGVHPDPSQIKVIGSKSTKRGHLIQIGVNSDKSLTNDVIVTVECIEDVQMVG